MDEKKVIDLTDEDLIRELVFCHTMKKHYYSRYDEIVREMERRYENGK